MARFKEWSPELERALAEPFPPEFVQQKKKGGSQVSFVGWHVYVLRLNELVGPGWSMGEPILKEVGGKLIMGVPVSIFGVTRVNFGSEDEEHGNADEDGKVRDFGSAETNSFAQSLKRTLALFGLGLSLYDKSGAWEKHKERSAHAAALEWIRDVGARCEEELEIKVGNGTRNLKAYVRENWPAMKEQYRVARATVEAIETATGQTFNP